MDLIVTYQWELFISLEILSFLFLIGFLIVRYAFTNTKLSLWFISAFFFFFALEALLAWIIYKETGEISTFTIIIAIFLIYAVTFGISDFRKLDRYIKQKVGKWRGINLLTDKDIRKIEQAKDPKYISRKSAIWWFAHTAVFIAVHIFFWTNYGNHAEGILFYLTDWSWFGDEGFESGPFNHEMIAAANKIWLLIYGLDTIISWSYILFPGKRE